MYKLRYTALDPYGVTSYGISEYLISPCGRVKKSVQTREIIYMVNIWYCIRIRSHIHIRSYLWPYEVAFYFLKCK